MQLVLDCKILYCSKLNSLCETGIGNLLVLRQRPGSSGLRTARRDGRPWRPQGKLEVSKRNSPGPDLVFLTFVLR